jgi:hypothetical protein
MGIIMKKLSILASIVALLINFSAVAEETLGTCDKVQGEVSKAACDAANGVWVEASVAPAAQ